ncbi:MAG: MMPL family transporter [Solirubrobacteraceae bacterium]
MRAVAALATTRPRRVLLGALAFVLVAAVLGGPVAGQLQDSGGFTPEDSGSARAIERVNDATGLQASPGILLLVDDPDAGGLRALTAQLERVPGVARVDPSPPSERSGAIYLAATLRANADGGTALAAAEERFGGQQGLTLGGHVFADTQVGDSVTSDLGRAELLALPILLLLSLLFFRGRAALIPLAVGVTTVLATFLVLGLINRIHGLSIFALNLVIGLGLGLAIDYTLFLLTRFREELDGGDDVRAALETTLRTAGRTIVYSALTVALSLLTLVLFPLNFLQSMGAAGAVVAVASAVASLLVGSALLGLWGTKLQLPARRRAEQRWYRLAHAVMRRPGLVAASTALVMLVAAAPALRAEWTPVDASVIPKDKSSRTVVDRLTAEFPTEETSPVAVVLTAPPGATGELRAYAETLVDLPGAETVAEPRSLDEGTWVIAVTPEGTADGEPARRLVQDVRATPAPFPALVGGDAAEFVDQQEAIGSRLPLAGALLCLFVFVVLWLMTGSLLLPIKAIVMNVLTVAASLGVLVLVFQDGRFADFLDYTPNGGVEPTDFLVAATLIFALSTDYGVFLLGRIKEARTTIADEREAVAVGLERTGAVVTAAAILLAVAIGAFITSSISFIQQIGVAAAAGVLLDAFVVRALLVPALMALLGRWNWWSPAPLARLHARIGLAED